MTTNDDNRIRHLDSLLALIDSPKEGDTVLFTIEGDSTKYTGVIKQKKPTAGTAYYQIVTNTQPAPVGKVATIEYNGRTFKSGGPWQPL